MSLVHIPPIIGVSGSFLQGRVDIDLVGVDKTTKLGWLDDINLFSGKKSYVITDTTLSIPLPSQSRLALAKGENSFYRITITCESTWYTTTFYVQVPNTDSQLADLVAASEVPAVSLPYNRLLPTPQINSPFPYFVTLRNGVVQYEEASLFGSNGSEVRNGYLDRTEVDLSFDNATRTVTIQPVGSSFQFYSFGTLYTLDTPVTFQVGPEEGNHFVYFDEAGVVHEVSTFESNLINKWCWICAVYWNPTMGSAVPDAFNELHGYVMDSDTHMYLHTTVGTAYNKDGGILPSALVYDGDGSQEDHVRVSVTSGMIRDEDIPHTIPEKSGADVIPVLYREGSTWFFNDSDAAVVRTTGTGRAAYNHFDGSAWSVLEAPNNSYVFAHLYAIPGLTKRLMILMGTNYYNGISSVRANAAKEIQTIQGIPFLEFKAIATFAVQTSNSYSNATKSRIVSVNSDDAFEDWRYN